jgi:hypothetical protein
MPNWCENELTITGNPAQIAKLIEFVKGNHWGVTGNTTDFDFQKVIPYPKKFMDIDEKANKFEVLKEELQKKFKDKPAKLKGALDTLAITYGLDPERPWIKDGYNSGGYEWCISNWGTKWNAAEVTMENLEDEVIYSFDTAWSPPVPIISKLAQKFKKCRFTLEYWERGAAYQGTLICEDGEVTVDITHEYYGHRGG